MNDKEFLEITSSIEKKLGDQSAIIADDLGKAITGFETMKKELKDRDAKIKELTQDKEKLVSANSNLLRQIPVTSDDGDSEPDDSYKTPSYDNFDFKDCFDEKGNFKK